VGLSLLRRAVRDIFLGCPISRLARHGKETLERLRETLLVISTKMRGFEDCEDFFAEQLVIAIKLGSMDVINAVFESDIVTALGTSQVTGRILSAAAKMSQECLFNLLLYKTPKMTLELAHCLLSIAIQSSGVGQLQIVRALIERLSKDDLAVAAVNYSPRGTCGPSCMEQHIHSWHKNLFWSAITEGSFDIAAYLFSFCDLSPGQFTTLFFLVRDGSTNVLAQILFVFNCGPEHSKFICDPVRNSSVLHVAAKSLCEFHQSVIT
jgi:hypothetical protein